MKHPADSIYTISTWRLRQLGACKAHTDRIEKVFGTNDIPITHAKLDFIMNKQWLGLAWAVGAMRRAGRINDDEHREFIMRYYNMYFASDNAATYAAKLFMDLLEKRAEREGRLP